MGILYENLLEMAHSFIFEFLSRTNI